MRRKVLARRAAATMVALVAAGVLSTLAVLATRMIISGHRSDRLSDATAQAERLWLLGAEQAAVYGELVVLKPAAPEGQSWSIEAAATDAPGQLRITATVRRGGKVAAMFSQNVPVDTADVTNEP